MPPTGNDNANPSRRTRRVPPDGFRWFGSVRQFRWLLLLQQAVLAGHLGGPRDGAKCDPLTNDERVGLAVLLILTCWILLFGFVAPVR